MRTFREQQLVNALKDSDTLIRKAQALVSSYLEPDSGLTDNEVLRRLIVLLDGPEQRRVQEATRAVLEASAG